MVARAERKREVLVVMVRVDGVTGSLKIANTEGGDNGRTERLVT